VGCDATANYFVSATPGDYELDKTGGIFVEQVIRPTGLVDPPIEIHPTKHQIDNLLDECRQTITKGYRVMITTLTKKMAEDLTEYMHEDGLKVRYLHSDIDTLERIGIIRDLRLGVFNVLVGINLLREGLDIPECALMAILDADKEGYLRSKTSLIQTIGRASRNVDSKVIMYADNTTKSMAAAIDETKRRREKQLQFNKENNITPLSIKKNIDEILEHTAEQDHVTVEIENAKQLVGKDLNKYIQNLEKKMQDYASKLEFEEAAQLRDEINRLKAKQLGVPNKILELNR
jgi:excinuclease ABC subunit B